MDRLPFDSKELSQRAGELLLRGETLWTFHPSSATILLETNRTEVENIAMDAELYPTEPANLLAELERIEEAGRSEMLAGPVSGDAPGESQVVLMPPVFVGYQQEPIISCGTCKAVWTTPWWPGTSPDSGFYAVVQCCSRVQWCAKLALTTES